MPLIQPRREERGRRGLATPAPYCQLQLAAFERQSALNQPAAHAAPGRPLRYEKEGNIFDEDFTEFSSRERMHKWDRQWAYLKFLPQASAF